MKETVKIGLILDYRTAIPASSVNCCWFLLNDLAASPIKKGFPSLPPRCAEVAVTAAELEPSGGLH